MDIDDNLLLQYLLGNADEPVRNKVEKWLEADAGNRKYLDQLEALWLETGKLDPPPLPVDLQQAWVRISDRIEKHEARNTVRIKKFDGIHYLKYAISAAALILIVFGIYSIIKIYTVKVNEAEMISTASVLHDTLSDGSRIALNRQSKLKYPSHFQGRERLVKLTGEGFFEVSKDPLRPFIVDAGIAKVKVLGTAFSISAYPGQNIKVTVNEGRVLFFTLGSTKGDSLSIVLEAGMSGALKHGTLKPMIVENSAPDKLFWANHVLEFNRVPLSEVFGLVEKYYDVKISVSTPDIRNCRLSASFVNEPVNRIMTVIAESFGLKLSVDGNKYFLSGNGCSKENN
ncbi:MAG: FecR domain-containing protein [Bacteroidales bacterium]|nr:FecR domain-containing protein [Bacteroidales bacterium]